jgi:type I restriction enzyme S subunit
LGLTVNDKVFYKFLYYVLSTIDFGEFVNEGAVPSVNQSQIGCINIALPTLKEQIKIVEILTKIDHQIEDLLLKWDKLQLLKKGLTKKLLTGKIRVMS